MALETGATPEVISRNIGRLIEEGKSKEEAAALAYSFAGAAGDDEESARVDDMNGFFMIEEQPISVSGVYEYAGKRFPKVLRDQYNLDPDELYPVLRPADALADPEFLESCQLVPWIDEHTMLGAEELGRTPAENYGIQGTTGQKIRFDPDSGIVYANVKCYSERLRDMIDGGKRGLSLGYVCYYRHEEGELNGQPYMFVQHGLRANHLATVDEGRMGEIVEVLDETDRKKGATPVDKDVSEMTLDELTTLIETANQAREVLESSMNPDGTDADAAAGDDDDQDDAAVGDDDDAATTDDQPKDEDYDAIVGDDDDTAATPDSGSAATASAAANASNDDNAEADPTAVGTAADDDDASDADKASVAEDDDDDDQDDKDKQADAMDAAERRLSVAQQRLVRRDRLAKKLKPFIGVFDCSDKTLNETARYAAKKLGLRAPAGAELSVVGAFLKGRRAPGAATTRAVAMDGADRPRKSSFVQKQFGKRK